MTLKGDRDSLLNKVIIKIRPNWRHTVYGTIQDTEGNDQTGDNRKEKSLIYKEVMRAVEKYGFIFISGTFIGFNIIFWPWLLISSGYFEYHVNFEHNAIEDI